VVELSKLFCNHYIAANDNFEALTITLFVRLKWSIK